MVFIFLGDKLPEYAYHSIELAVRMNSIRPILISNARNDISRFSDLCEVVPLADFYDESYFRDVSKILVNSHSSNRGFWLRTFERLFVLQQFMSNYRIEELLHCELDQLLFGIQDLCDALSSAYDQGVFLPILDRQRAIASIMYCKGVHSLDSLLDFAKASGVVANEMEFLRQWMSSGKSLSYSLPTPAVLLRDGSIFNQSEMSVVESSVINGVVDAAQIGQWICGVDPRNVPLMKIPKTGTLAQVGSEHLNLQELVDLRISFRAEDKTLWINRRDQDPMRLYNLHVHSKIHKRLARKPKELERLIEASNSGNGTVLTELLIRQLRFSLNSNLQTVLRDPSTVSSSIRRRVNRSFNLRPSSSPFLSGDSFRSLADLILERSTEGLTPDKVLSGSVIFCESHLLESLLEVLEVNASTSLTLLLGNSDRNFSHSTLRAVSSAKAIRRAFVQNVEALNPNDSFIEILPIGLENQSLARNGEIRHFRKQPKSHSSRKNRIMWTFNIQTNPLVRSTAANDLIRVKTADYLGPVLPREHRKFLSIYSFVACPPGNGIDTHRMWEAIYSGCVPIILDSHLARRYRFHQLPVWVVDSYASLSAFEEGDLESIFNEYLPLFESDSIWFSYWKELILKSTLSS